MSPEERAGKFWLDSIEKHMLVREIRAAERSARAEAFREAAVMNLNVACPTCGAEARHACTGYIQGGMESGSRVVLDACHAGRWRAALLQRAEAEEHQ